MLTPNQMDGMGISVQNTFLNYNIPATPCQGRSQSLPRNALRTGDEPDLSKSEGVGGVAPANRLIAAAHAAVADPMPGQKAPMAGGACLWNICRVVIECYRVAVKGCEVPSRNLRGFGHVWWQIYFAFSFIFGGHFMSGYTQSYSSSSSGPNGPQGGPGNHWEIRLADLL